MSCFSSLNEGGVMTREPRPRTTAGVYERQQIRKDTYRALTTGAIKHAIFWKEK